MQRTFLDLYMEYCGINECPPCYHRWCGLFALSVALGRRCLTNMNAFNIYPNMYVLIVGDAGLQKKSTAIDMVQLVLNELQPKPNFISQKLTAPALVDSLRLIEPSLDNTMIGVKQSAEGYGVNDELKNLIDRTSYESGLGPMLTAFYDCKPNWDYHTKKDGKQPLVDVLLGLLCGSSPQFLHEALPEAAIGSGFSRRIIFVYTPLLMEPQPFPKKQHSLFPQLITHLSMVRKLSGEFHYGKDALDFYGKSYIDFRASRLWNDPVTKTYAGCRYTHVFKVAMALAVSENPYTLAVTKANLEDAILLLEEQEQYLPELMRNITSSDHGKMMDWVLALVGNAGMWKDEILRIVSSKLSNFDLEVILDTLESSRQVRREVVAGRTMVRLQPSPTDGDTKA